MGLTQKILLFTSVLVVALVATSLVFTTVQADRLAEENVTRGLTETRQVWETFQADRYNTLKLGIRVLGNDPAFKSLVETKDPATILDTLKERNEEIKADFFIVTDRSICIAVSCRSKSADRSPGTPFRLAVSELSWKSTCAAPNELI